MPPSIDLPEDLIAALTWDLPALQRGPRDAQAFADSFGSTAGDDEVQGESALAVAAQGVRYEREGAASEALRAYEGLTERSDPAARLLGLTLLCWTSLVSDEAVLHETEALVAKIKHPEVRARLYAKLATAALDKHFHTLTEQCWRAAIRAVPAGTRLTRALLIEGMNLGMEAAPALWGDDAEPLPPDALVDYPWIEELALSAAQEALDQDLEERVRGVWSYTFRAGRTPLDQVVAAEIQCTWAGALWLRRPLRKQLAVHLLTGGARAPAQWAYGILMWVLGGGRNVPSLYDFVEPRFDGQSADIVVRELAAGANDPLRDAGFLPVAAQAWDAVSDELAGSLLQTTEPGSSIHPNDEACRRLWMGLSLRDPHTWAERYASLSDDAKDALIDEMTPYVAQRLPAAAAAQVVISAERRAVTVPASSQPFKVLVALQSHTSGAEGARVQELLGQAPVDAVVDIAEEFPGRIPSHSLAEAARSLEEAVTREYEEAIAGRFGFGRISARLELGRLLRFVPESFERGLSVLLASAIDERVPPQLRVEARNGITAARRDTALPGDVVETLRTASDNPSGVVFGAVTHDLLRVARLRALAFVATEPERAELIVACRDTDARVRQTALAACGELLSVETDEAIEAAVVSALFDPSEEIVRVGLSLLQRRPFQGLGAREVARRRLVAIFEVSGREVRRQIVQAARVLLSVDPDQRDLAALVLTARGDRSWLVRDAAGN